MTDDNQAGFTRLYDYGGLSRERVNELEDEYGAEVRS